MIKVGVGSRVLTFLVDFFLIFLLSFGAFRAWDFYVFFYNIPYVMYIWFLLSVMFLYYLILESIFKRTPGKYLALTKVVNATGGKPTFSQIFIRSLVRILTFIVIDGIFISFMDKTAHDYFSKTETIEI